MGTHIYGWVEIKKFDTGFDDWFPVIDVGIVMSGNYDIYGCLFGVRNYANFSPLFPFRGVPPDCSEEIVREFAEGYEGITWCTYRELSEIDLDELSEVPDQRFYTEMKTPNGTALVKRFAQNEDEKAQCKYISRREALNDPEFQQLMELMQVLSKRYGKDGVRMVVYFDYI